MSLNRRHLATMVSAAALTLSACGQTDNNESPSTDIGSGPIPAPKDAGPDIADITKDFGKDLSNVSDMGENDLDVMDLGADLRDISDMSNSKNDLKLDCKFDPLNSKSAYQECIDEAELLVANLDDSKLNYISEYGIGAIKATTELTQEQSSSQPQLNAPETILDPSMLEVQTSTIVEGKIFCHIPEEGQIKVDKLTADPNLPFNNCDPGEESCDLSLELNGLDISSTGNLVTRFRFNCPELGLDPQVDGQSSNVDLGRPSVTVVVEVPFAQRYSITPSNCELDGSISVVATECRAFAQSLREDKYENFGEVFTTNLRLNINGN